MESIFGLENMDKEAAVGMMIQAYEKEIHEVARVSHLLKRPDLNRPAWYCRLLVHLGEMMVAFGTHLKTHYSLDLRFSNEKLEVS